MIYRILLASVGLLVGVHALAQTVIKKIKPGDTDSLITTFNTDSNYVYFNPAVSTRNILLVHLPGSFGEPKRATLFGAYAANLGFHSIGLMYPNAPTVGSFCTNSADATCFEAVRREIVEGVDYSNDISIPYNEGIINRTKRLLKYLKMNFPSENWGQFLDVNGEPAYSKIIFSGHSQGGGHAALIAKFYPLKKAICFSSPKDWRNIPDSPPLWLSTGNWQTPPGAIYAFNHVLDEHTNHQLEIWDSLGLGSLGSPVNIDGNPAPYNHTRQLTTAYSVPIGDDHACTIQDNKTPKVSGIPVFIPVWNYMLTDNLTTDLKDTRFNQKSGMQPFPNPTSDVVNFELKDEPFLVSVYDQTGKCVMLQNPKSGKTTINLTGLSAGLYLIYATGCGKIFTGKVVKH